MQALQLPDDFQKSCLNSRSYPENLIHRSTNTYPTALTAFRTRLDSAESDLFLDNEDHVEVPFRDLRNAKGEDPEKYNIHTSTKLTSWLGIETTADPTDPTKLIFSAKKHDPKCRFIYIYGEHSRAKLKITRAMLTQILTLHQVMPVYLDFMSVFGAQSEQRDLRFSGFREQTTLTDPPRGPAVPSLGRSGRQYQLCYNLKSVVLKSEDKTNIRLNEWSIRQAAIHHQFDVVEGTTLWIITKGHLDLQERFKELTGKDGRPEDKSFGTPEDCFRSSLAAHLLYCHWSLENWRWYIRWLENVIEDETAMALYAPRGPGHAHQQYKPKNVQYLQRWEDRTNEVIMVLEANNDVMSSLCKFYNRLGGNKHVPSGLKNECGPDIDTFTARVEDMIYEFKMQISRAKLLVKITSDRKEIVIQHLQTQATERMERLNQNMEKEAIVMRIITLVTLVYLPATFVSTFFSTDVIKYQNQSDAYPENGSFSQTAMNRWLQVTVPLTLLTFVLAWFTLLMAERKRKNQEHPKKKQQKKAVKTQSSLLPMYNEPKIITWAAASA